jgi:hypothetical protein
MKETKVSKSDSKGLNKGSAKGLERMPARKSLDAKALLWFGESKDPCAVVVRNISSGGMMAVCDVPVAIGDRVEAKIEKVGDVSGRVAWAVSPRIGIAFDAPLDV